ncbi:MAG: UbiA family prenyltransferase [Thaumarchaeota archaeon]|nr:UbiA family prenyltransferase [Nitrososphaerota archaeon]
MEASSRRLRMKGSLPSLSGYLRFFRLESASTPMTYLVLGYLIGGGSLLSAGTAVWLLFGLIFHMAGFGDNNLQDLSQDLADPNKEVFPLGRSMPVAQARRAVLGLHMIGLAFALLISGSVTGASIFAVCYASGIIYNRSSKSWASAPIFFALTFAPLAAFSYYSVAGHFGPLIVLVSGLAFFECLFQNAVATSLKDLHADRMNFMKTIGAREESGLLFVPRKAWAVTLAIKGCQTGTFVGLATLVPAWTLLVGVPFLVISLFGSARTIAPRPSEQRSRLMLHAAISELGSFYAVLGFLLVVLGTVSVLFLAVFPLAWYILVKKALWGSVGAMMA